MTNLGLFDAAENLNNVYLKGFQPNKLNPPHQIHFCFVFQQFMFRI